MEEHEDVRRAGREVVGAKADVLPMTTAAATLMISSDRTMMCRYSFDGGPSVRSVWLYYLLINAVVKNGPTVVPVIFIVRFHKIESNDAFAEKTCVSEVYV